MTRTRAVLLVLLLLALGLLATQLPLLDLARGLIDRVRDAGAWGALAYGVAAAVAIVLMVPGSLLTLGAGFLYGPGWGLLVASPASVLGATGGFLVARYLLRSQVAERLGRLPRVAAIDKAVGERGLQVVLLLRLSPVLPFILLNYALGLSGVRLGAYVLGSAVGMLPITCAYVYLGSLVPSVAGLGGSGLPEGPLGQALLWGGLAATVALTVYLTRLASRALKAAAPDVEEL